MYKKYADYNVEGIVKKEFKTLRVDNEEFKGYVSLLNFIESNRKEKFFKGKQIEFALTRI